MYLKRSVEPVIKKHLFKAKVLIILGPRQSGKTTLAKKLISELKLPAKFINCDEWDSQKQLSLAGTSTQLKQLTGENKLIIIDEGQRVKNIGLKLKLLVDNYPKQQIIATGSSAFELANEIVEPLTGRNFQFWLYPFSLSELTQVYDSLVLNRLLSSFLIYGTYPKIALTSSLDEKSSLLKSLVADYLYKDILAFQNLKKAETIQRLLEALALQLGNEVSYNELASLTKVSKQTIMTYLNILEKAFIIFKLRPFSRNLRKELGKLHKIYFWDTGVRNTLINNFNPLSLRQDTGALWENFMIAEIKKSQYWIGRQSPLYFWRTYDQQEIDLVKEEAGHLEAWEFKWQKMVKAPQAWQKTYPDASWRCITSQNYQQALQLSPSLWRN